MVANLKTFFREIGILVLLNGLVFLIYSSAFGESFHATVPGNQAFADEDVKIMASFLFFYPTLTYTTALVYFFRAKRMEFRHRLVNFIAFSTNVIAIGFPLLALYYDPGLRYVIADHTPMYDPLILPITAIEVSAIPLFITLFYSAHHIPLAFEYYYDDSALLAKNIKIVDSSVEESWASESHNENVFIEEFAHFDHDEKFFYLNVYEDYLDNQPVFDQDEEQLLALLPASILEIDSSLEEYFEFTENTTALEKENHEMSNQKKENVHEKEEKDYS